MEPTYIPSRNMTTELSMLGPSSAELTPRIEIMACPGANSAYAIPGTLKANSVGPNICESLSSSPLMAVTATPISCRFSSRYVEVTMTSSSCPPWANTGALPNVTAVVAAPPANSAARQAKFIGVCRSLIAYLLKVLFLVLYPYSFFC